jgi:YD repeat-containing protein
MPANLQPQDGKDQVMMESAAPRKSRGRLALVVSLVLLALLALLTVQLQWNGWSLPLRWSSVVREAVTRVRDDPRVAATLGQPVRAGWYVYGNTTRDETGWTEAFLWIPLSGPKGDGTLYVRAGRSSGPWTFSALELRVGGERLANLLDEREPVHRELPTEPQPLSRNDAEQADGRYPCFVARALDGHAVDAQTKDCLPGLRADRRYDEVEVNLRGGFLVVRDTDFFAEDDMSLAFTRCFRMWDTASRAFGIGWNHPYDILPVGSRNPYTYVNLIMPDGEGIHYARISEGTGYADAVYEHTATQTPFLHSTFRWNGTGWDLRFADGALFLFPENYSGTRPHHGAPTAMEDGHGHAIKFRRDRDRNLEQVTSPSGHVIRLEHDGESRVTSAVDERGRLVRYTYDARGNLAAVRDGGRVTRYGYIDSNLVSIATGMEPAASPGSAATSGVSTTPDDSTTDFRLRAQYTDGRVSALTLADGRSFHFRFSVSADSNVITEATVIAPDGSQTRIAMPPAPEADSMRRARVVATPLVGRETPLRR